NGRKLEHALRHQLRLDAAVLGRTARAEVGDLEELIHRADRDHVLQTGFDANRVERTDGRMLRRLAVLLARDGALAGGARRAAVGAAAAGRVAEGRAGECGGGEGWRCGPRGAVID